MSDQPRADGVVHEVDGIEECDNELPRWWLFTFFATIAFGACYFLYYDVLDGEPLGRAYRRELAQRLEAQGKSAPITAAMIEDLRHDPTAMGEAAATFEKTCASCHLASGAGAVGPNLTDDYWLHGGSAEQIFASVHDGYPAKGMPAWGAQLGEAKIPKLAAYVVGLRGTNVAGGKAPQGDKYQP